MPLNYLRLRFRDDGYGIGVLFARTEADGFSGAGEAYFDITEIENFAKAVSIFPLPAGICPAISGGVGTNAKYGERLGITVSLWDAQRGYVAVQVRMQTETWRLGRLESLHSARIEILTTYQPLADFGKELINLVHGRSKEAFLYGECIF